MRPRLLLPLLAVLLAGCRPGVVQSGETTTSTAPPPTVTSTSAPGAPASTTSSTAATSTTTSTLPPDAAPRFALTEVVFGGQGYVEVTNVGDAPGSPAGHLVCAGDPCVELTDVRLETRDSIWIAVGDPGPLEAAVGVDTVAIVPAEDFEPFNVETGEAALYERPGAILSYVQWGQGGQPRAAEAAEAGVWPQDGVVETPPSAFGLRAVLLPPEDPSHWLPSVGG